MSDIEPKIKPDALKPNDKKQTYNFLDDLLDLMEDVFKWLKNLFFK